MLKVVLATLVWMAGGLRTAGAEELDLPGMPRCAAVRISEPCMKGLTKSEAARMSALIGQDRRYVEMNGDSLLVAFDATNATFLFGDRPFLCCDLQAQLPPVRDRLFGARIEW
ncbi:hypothetical protein [Pseudoduganella chitinolytica]|uniref:Uncharacterized protein n=1 Tax=Pseudoduganella chitinolytica TaxID=34070 RepID=A0ABY8BKD0_9BURK|nr:hypothetical protein [Pseudoduganella chitinolytica]WEF35137.1 hypothetical protein PX653_10345 [Pseudoduganella chitinolytica]